MVDLKGQYLKIKEEVDKGIQDVIDSSAFINGPSVKSFTEHLSLYMGGCNTITCANGTDALQIALMALNLKPGDEVIVPAFTYVASAEVIGLLGLTPVMVDVNPRSFNTTVNNLKKGLSTKTKAIIPVHLFGQCCDMEPIVSFAKEYGLFIIEDNAQALGASYTFSDTHTAKSGTMGTIGCTSFFPSKNLGCFGDGGALFTNDAELADRIRMIANHGQKVKYHHMVIGCNSRLDSIQAAILDVKLKYLDEYCQARHAAATYYTDCLKSFDPNEEFILTPVETASSTHVYHQYTIRVPNEKRDALKQYLSENGIPSMIYYPLPLQKQKAFLHISRAAESLDHAEECSSSVLSLPIHTELTREVQDFILEKIISFFK